jgi:hypothetical protein
MIESLFSLDKEICHLLRKSFGASFVRPAKWVLRPRMAGYRLGHHVSVNFDLSTEKSLKREQLERTFLFLGRPTVLQDEKILFLLSSLLHREAASWLRFSFFGGASGLAASGFLNRAKMVCFGWPLLRI